MKIAILISGGGTTAASVISECRPGGRLEGITPVLVISSRPDAPGIQRVIEAGMAQESVIVIERSKFPTPGTFGSAIVSECEKRGVEFIGQYGWMVLTPANVVDRYKGMMVNQHPGPLDIGREDFGGAGMYGLRVHAARICFVEKTGHDYWSEATAQLVAEEFDSGKVLRTGRVPIMEGDTPEMLAERMLPVEHQVQIQALEDFIHNRVSVMHREEPLVSPEEVSILEACKKQAILMYPKG